MRDRDFAECCAETVRRARFNNEYPTPAEAIARAMSMRPRAYYVSIGYAYTQVLNIRRIGPDRYSASATQPSDMMWLEIYERVMAAMVSRRCCSLFDALVCVMEQRPSRFYISRRRATEIFNDAVRRGITFTPRKTY